MTQAELNSDDLPAQYRDANDAAAAGQRAYLRLTRLRLVCLVAAAVAGAITYTAPVASTQPSPSPTLWQLDWAGILGAFAFVLAVVFEAWIMKTRPERRWYAGRAAAESVKTVAWRYAVGGNPFPLGEGRASDAETNKLFVARLASIEEITREAEASPGTTPRDQITARMREARTLLLDDRKRTYCSGRIENQCDWYAAQARTCRRNARTFAVSLLLLEVAGAAAALGRAAGIWAFDILGVIGALAAAVAAWIAIKQYSSLAAAYGVASNELSRIKVELLDVATEEHWAMFVDQSEEAISREHTLWLASRSDDAALLRAARRAHPSI